MLTAHEVLAYAWLYWKRFAHRIPGSVAMGKASNREARLLLKLAKERTFALAAPDPSDEPTHAFGYIQSTQTVWFARSYLTGRLRRTRSDGAVVDESKVLVDPIRPFLKRLAHLERHVPEHPDDPLEFQRVFVGGEGATLRHVLDVEPSRLHWFGPVHAEYSDGILWIRIVPYVEETTDYAQLLQRLNVRYRDMLAGRRAIPLYLGDQYYPGLKQGTEIWYEGATNEVVVKGRCDHDAPSFGAPFHQIVRPGSVLLLTVNVRGLGTTQWGRGFFRVDVDDQHERRFALHVIEPAESHADGDAYVQQPRAVPTTIAYCLALPDTLRVLRRLQIVLAANEAYDLTFSDFALLEPTK